MSKTEGVGDRFQRATEYQRDRELREPDRSVRKPRSYKDYRGARRIRLDRPDTRRGPPLWKTIRARRSERDLVGKPLTRRELSQMLWAAQGITSRDADSGLRAAPSAGALYPVETYVVARSVDGIEPGVYHYGVRNHQLELIRAGDFTSALEAATLEQDLARHAGAVFIWSGVFDRCKWKYGQRAYRYIYLDAGHIGQNLALAAAAAGLGSCPIGAFYDNELNAIIEVDGKSESVIYLAVVGRTGHPLRRLE